jgi:hypothetical protein
LLSQEAFVTIFPMKKICLYFLLLSLIFPNSAFALYGSRPMGMGGAFTAVANDASAAYWNPAGFALNPGVDIYGSTLLTNRNEKIGDNLFAMKLCYETELDPFAWVLGVGAASLLAYEGAQYLSDQGVLKKNWGGNNNVEKVGKDEPISDKVLSHGDQNTTAVGTEVKDTAKKVAKDSLNALSQATTAIGKSLSNATVQINTSPVYWGPMYYPWYRANYSHPTYWDEKPKEPQGKAQFALGLTYLMDKNATAKQNINYYTLSLATGYAERFAIGGNINFYDIDIIAPTTTLKGYGAGIDLGVIAKPVENFSLGLAAKEILTTDIRLSNGSIYAFKMGINAGAAYDPIEQLTVAADIQNIFNQNNENQTYHYGAEFRPFPGLALRGGLYDGSKTAGLSIMVMNAIIDYCYLGGAFDRTQTFAVTWKL